MSAVVSNAPASAASAATIAAAGADVEALALDPTRDQPRPGGHTTTTSGDAAAVELATDRDAVDAPAGAASAGGAQPNTTPRAMEGSSLPFLSGIACLVSWLSLLFFSIPSRPLVPYLLGASLMLYSYVWEYVYWTRTVLGPHKRKNTFRSSGGAFYLQYAAMHDTISA